MKPMLITKVKGLLILLCLSLSTLSIQAQLIDSTSVNIQSSPNEIYVKILGLDGSKHNFRIDSVFQNNTMQINFIFKDCSAPANVFEIDTSVRLFNFEPTGAYNVRIVTYLDTNTVDNDCTVRTSYEYFDSVYIPASSIFIGQSEQLLVANKIDLFPNPAKSYFEIDQERFPGNNIDKVFLFNATGSLLRSWFYDPDMTFDVQKMRQGVYFVHVLLNDKSRHVSKLIISN